MMPASFSAKVKEELARTIPPARHCRIAEIAAMLSIGGRFAMDDGGKDIISFRTENVPIARKYFTLLKKTFNIESSVSVRRETGLNKSRIYSLEVIDDEKASGLIMACSLHRTREGRFVLKDDLLLQRDCCRRAFIRGAFLASGSISDPVRSYHFEIVCSSRTQAELLQSAVCSFQIGARLVMRKSHYVVYVKDSSQVVDLLNVMGAYKALMDMENVRIVKDMRNRINRGVNCETANISKTANASAKQILDITYIMDSSAFHRLPESLRQVASLRLSHPEATLTELGAMLDPPVGKSGVNHRMKKISDYARDLRDGSGEKTVK